MILDNYNSITLYIKNKVMKLNSIGLDTKQSRELR